MVWSIIVVLYLFQCASGSIARPGNRNAISRESAIAVHNTFRQSNIATSAKDALVTLRIKYSR